MAANIFNAFVQMRGKGSTDTLDSRGPRGSSGHKLRVAFSRSSTKQSSNTSLGSGQSSSSRSRPARSDSLNTSKRSLVRLPPAMRRMVSRGLSRTLTRSSSRIAASPEIGDGRAVEEPVSLPVLCGKGKDPGEVEESRFISKVNRRCATERLVTDLEAHIDASQPLEWPPAGTPSCPVHKHNTLACFRDGLLSEAWAVVVELKARLKQETCEAIEKARLAEKQQRDMQAAALEEITALRDRLRTFPDGTVRALDVTFCEPLAYISTETRRFAEACIEERLKQLIADAVDKQAKSELAQLVRSLRATEPQQAAVAPSRSLSLQMRVEAVKAELEATQRELDSVRRSLGASEEECQRMGEQLAAAMGEVEELRSSGDARLDTAHSSLGEARALLEKALQECQRERLRRAAVERALAEANEQPAPLMKRELSLPAGMDLESPFEDEPWNECRPVLPNASPAVLMDHALEVQQQIQNDPGKAMTLLQVLGQLGNRLDYDVVNDSGPPPGAAAQLLLLRVRTSRQDGNTLVRTCLSLMQALGNIRNAAIGSGSVHARLPAVLKQLDVAQKAEVSCALQCLKSSMAGMMQLEAAQLEVRAAARKLMRVESFGDVAEMPGSPAHDRFFNTEDDADIDFGPSYSLVSVLPGSQPTPTYNSQASTASTALPPMSSPRGPESKRRSSHQPEVSRNASGHQPEISRNATCSPDLDQPAICPKSVATKGSAGTQPRRSSLPAVLPLAGGAGAPTAASPQSPTSPTKQRRSSLPGLTPKAKSKSAGSTSVTRAKSTS